MSKPIKCPSCNKNMYILSNAISGEGGELYSAKVECGMCMTRFCPVLQTNELNARRWTAKLTREWIANAFPMPLRAPGSRWKKPLEFPHYPPADQGWRIPPVVKMSVDELMSLRSQSLLSDTEAVASEDRIENLTPDKGFIDTCKKILKEFDHEVP